MKIIEVRSLPIPDIRVIRYAQFQDPRGYFTETFRHADFQSHSGLGFLRNLEFVQVNESHSLPHVIRGLHFQWNPVQGKLVRPVVGHILDLVLDIRQESPYHGKAIAYGMQSRPEDEQGEWIWIPPGFAHGFVSLEPSTIEYFCTSSWSPGCEAGILPFDEALDWSLCDPALRDLFHGVKQSALVSDKDRRNMTLAEWDQRPQAGEFVHP